MKQIRKTLKMFNPLNGLEETPTAIYIMKKVFAFFIIYMAATILQQIVLTGIFFVAGYDPVNGVMPAENVQTLYLYYGFAAFLLLVFLYCKFVEKRSLKSIGVNRKISDYILGVGLAVVLLLIVVVICCIFGAISFTGMNRSVDCISVIALLGGLIVQGAAEEFMCRGFLMTSLMKKTSVSVAIFWSATAFAFPHFFNLFTEDFVYVMIGIVNLYLISIVFSFLMLYRKNIWISCGLHSIWNFLLYGVMGMTLSGNEAGKEGIFCFKVNEATIINGGSYGIESSIITTVVLGIVAVGVYRLWVTKGRKEDGIQ